MKQKQNTKIAALISLLIILVPLTSCTGNTKMDPGQPLTVYYSYSSGSTNKDVLERYNRTTGEKDREIEVREFEDTEQANQTIATEILAGKGPDVFVFDETGLEKYLSYAKEGAFEDLNPYFEKDSTISLDDYNQKILDYGIFDKKRYFIPLAYQINAVFTSEQTLQSYGLEPSTELCLDNLGNYVENVPDKKDNRDVYIFDSNEFLRNMLLSASIDGNTGIPSYQNNNFYSKAESIHKISHKEFTDVTGKLEAFKNRNLLFLSGQDALLQGFSAEGIYTAYRANTFVNKSSDTLIPKGIKFNQSDKGYYATPKLIVAINSNCKDKEQAFRFVKYLMSESIQNWDSLSNHNLGGLPINISSLEQIKQLMIDDEQKTYGTNSGYREYLDACFKIVDQVIGCRSAYFDVKYAKEIFDPLFNDYLNNKISVEELGKQLDSKTELYMKEN